MRFRPSESSIEVTLPPSCRQTLRFHPFVLRTREDNINPSARTICVLAAAGLVGSGVRDEGVLDLPEKPRNFGIVGIDFFQLFHETRDEGSIQARRKKLPHPQRVLECRSCLVKLRLTNVRQ